MRDADKSSTAERPIPSRAVEQEAKAAEAEPTTASALSVTLEAAMGAETGASEEPSEEELVVQEASRLMTKDQRILEQSDCERPADRTFDERVADIRRMMDTPRFREIYFAILDFCLERRTLGQVELLVGARPEFEYCGQNQYRLIANLEDAGALERTELDEDGCAVTEDRKEGLTEDEIDDLVVEYAFDTSDAGRVVCDEMQPAKRMKKLMDLFPQRVKAYCQVLEFCKTPRSFKEIDALLKGSEVLKSGSANTITNIPLQPSVFIEQLERSGGLVWKGSWNITEGGRNCLESVQKLAG